MTTEITVYEKLNAVGQAVNTMSNLVKMGNRLRKKEMIVLEEELRYLKTACRMKGYGQLARLAADEMEHTLRHYESKNFPEYMQGWVVNTLRTQYEDME